MKESERSYSPRAMFISNQWPIAVKTKLETRPNSNAPAAMKRIRSPAR